MFEKLKAKTTARKAYGNHINGNQMIDKGDMEHAREKHAEALRQYAEAYAAGLREARINMAYAVLLMRYNRSEEAKALLLECEKMPGLDHKQKKQLLINYSVCQWKLGNIDRAIELMESAGSNGMTATIYTTLGYYYVEKGHQTGDFEKAIEFNQKSMEYDDEDAGILDNVGQQYFFMGDHDKAYEYFAKAYNAKPTQVATLYYIAYINVERGNFEKANAFIDRCLEGNFSALATITHAQAEQLKKQIESKLNTKE